MGTKVFPLKKSNNCGLTEECSRNELAGNLKIQVPGSLFALKDFCTKTLPLIKNNYYFLIKRLGTIKEKYKCWRRNSMEL